LEEKNHMKLRKVLSTVIAFAMAGTLAATASANVTLNNVNTSKPTFTAPITGVEGDWSFQLHVSGSSVTNPNHRINHELIRGVRFTFNLTEKVAPDDPEADMLYPVAVAVNLPDLNWTQKDFCYEKDGKSYTFDLSANKFVPGDTEDSPGTGLTWLQVAATSWEPGNNGTVFVEVLGENNVVLALGQQELAGSTPGNTTNNTTSNSSSGSSSTGGDKDLDTGIAGVAILGGVAILATGAVIVTRRRK
jgi:hypothetical protein